MISAFAKLGRFYSKLKEVSVRKGKNSFLMLLDVFLSGCLFGSTPSDYLKYEFYSKTLREKSEYATLSVQNRFYKRVSPEAYKKVFTDKPDFLRAFHSYIDRDYLVPAEVDYSRFADYVGMRDAVMVKPYDGTGGTGVKKVRVGEIADLKAFYEELVSNRMFLEDVVIQHEALNRLCPASVNTARVMTVNTDGNPRIVFACLRVGDGTAEVDNFHSGGMAVLVDIDSGTLKGEAANMKTERFPRHPQTGVLFDGFELPFWEKVKEIVCSAALVEPRIRMVGWDVAITPGGPVFVEGNRRPGFDLPQIINGRGRKDIIRETLKAI